MIAPTYKEVLNFIDTIIEAHANNLTAGELQLSILYDSKITAIQEVIRYLSISLPIKVSADSDGFIIVSGIGIRSIQLLLEARDYLTSLDKVLTGKTPLILQESA